MLSVRNIPGNCPTQSRSGLFDGVLRAGTMQHPSCRLEGQVADFAMKCRKEKRLNALGESGILYL